MKYWFAAIGVVAWTLGVLLVGHAIASGPELAARADLPPGVVPGLLTLNALRVVCGLLLVLLGQVSLIGFQFSRQPRSSSF